MKTLSRAYDSAQKIKIGVGTRIILMSDCHRGNGSRADGFAGNRNIYYAALSRYFNEGFTYIELGDGDELWENNDLCEIMQTHPDVYRLLSEFYREGRLYMLYGNHDMVKKNSSFQNMPFDCGIDSAVFRGLRVTESLVLETPGGREILLVHGHQADAFNDRYWRVARFLVRHIWRPLELIGVNDPTSASRRPGRRGTVENRLANWAELKKTTLIAGHTHRALFPKASEPPCYNDGCCVHPHGITGIEIDSLSIALVRWSVRTRADGTLYVGKETMAGPRLLETSEQAHTGVPLKKKKSDEIFRHGRDVLKQDERG